MDAASAAWSAAWDEADAVWDEADAVWDAALWCCPPIIREFSPKHIEHIEARWKPWQQGYALLCDIDGTLYVYGAVNS